MRKAAAEEEARRKHGRKAGTSTNGFAKVLHVEASLRQVAEKEQNPTPTPTSTPTPYP